MIVGVTDGEYLPAIPSFAARAPLAPKNAFHVVKLPAVKVEVEVAVVGGALRPDVLGSRTKFVNATRAVTVEPVVPFGAG